MKKNKLLLILFALIAFGQMAWAQSIVSVNYVDENGVTQPVNAISLDEIAQVNPNGATIGTSGFTNCYVVQGSNVVMNGQLGYYGGINLILCDGAKLTINNTNGNAIQSLDNTQTITKLTIYVQSYGTGQLVANAAIQTENITINGGVISVTSGGTGIHADDNLIINRGTVTVNSDGNAMYGYNVTINGGNVSATSTGNAGIANGATGTITLGYTTNNDRIYASSYQVGYTASLRVKDGQYFITDDGQFVYGGYNKDYVGFLAGRTLSPFIPTEWSGGGNNANDPYIITSVYDLNLLSLRARAGEDYTGKYFRLDANITFTHSTEWDDITDPESNFTAISIFDGHFNGNSHSISGLRLHTSNNFVEQKGFFNNLGPNAYIENLTISNARIAGEKQVGAIVGYAQEGAIITNCHVTGTVTVYAYGNTLQKHGGIVGYNSGTVSNCVSEVTISRSIYYAYGSENVGGIAGYNTGSLSGNKVFNADITAASSYGAIAGSNENGTLTNNYYRACTINGTANVTNKGCDGEDVTANDGALSLHTIAKPNDVNNGTSATITYNNTSYWAQGKTITLSGGLSGTPTEGWQKAYYINGVALQENSTTISHTFDMPAEDVTITIGEIHADWAIANAGTQADPYKIYFTDQLSLLATRVNDGTSTYSGEYFQLMDDLTYDNTEQNNYIAIGTSSHPFKGHFNGNQKTIYGIRIYGTGSYQGAFGYIVDAEVKDLYVNDIMISGHDRVGCIVGECDGSTTITNCRVTTATLTATGDSSSQQLFGGIAGHNSGTSTMSNNFVLGATISYVYHFGAIAGENGGSLVSNYYHNCFKDGTAFPTGIGCNGGDVGGAEPVFTVSVPDGVTAAATATVTHNTVNYYKEGVTVTLSGGLDGTPAVGRQYAYVVYGETLIGSNLAPGHEFDMQNANAVVTIGSMIADWAAEEGAGDTEENPYKIYYKEQLDLLATRVNAGNYYSGKYFKLMDDLTYDNTKQNNYIAIGTGSNPFSGHFDGNHKTIEGIRIYGTGSYQGVFGYIVDAEVKDLYVNDIVIAGHDRVGCIVGECDGSTTITDCRVTTATLNVTGDSSYQQLFGGIAGRKSGSTMSNNFVLGITIPQTYHFGAIAGENGGSNQSLVSNYYHNCTVGSTAYPTGIGCNAIDVEGAKPVFTLTLADDISASPTPAVVYNTEDYYENGVTIHLTYVTPAAPGYEHIYSVNGTPIPNYGTSFNINSNSEVTVADQLIDWAENTGDDEENAYLIYNVEQWNLFADRVNGTNANPQTYSGKFFKLMEDISITEMVGGGDGSSNIFSGTFDGNGHTITFNAENATEQYIAPFRRIDGATIMGVKLEGTVSSINRFAGGIVAYAKGTSTVTNCINSTNISTVNYNLTDSPSNGGIVGMVGGNGTINISGCVFNGQMHGTQNNNWCGILGLCNGGCTANISNCFFAPEAVTLGSGNHTIYRNNGVATTPTNCYYTQAMGTNQGDKVYTITPAEPVTVQLLGVAQGYDVSSITLYDDGGSGLKFDDVHYAASGSILSLKLGVEPGYSASAYCANGTELNEQGYYLDSYKLTMPEQNVTITATLENVFTKEILAHGTTTADGGWYLIASPIGAVAATAVTNLASEDNNNGFDLYRFDESADLEWQNWKQTANGDEGHYHFDLEAGRGYLYANAQTVTLTFSDTPYNGDGEVTLSRSTGAPFEGWNLVGNPFAATAYIDRPFYTMNETGSEIMAESTSGRIGIMQGVFVIANNDNEIMTFSKTAPTNNSQGNLNINMMQASSSRSSNSLIDRAIVSFNESNTLPKFQLFEGSTKIYIPQGNEDYAIVSTEKQGEMPLNFEASENGTYTISVNPEGVEMAYLHLIDNMTGADVDVLASPTYTFQAKTTDYASRFRLVFVARDASTSSESDETFAFYSNGSWIISNEGEATLQVIDINGHILSNESINGSVSTTINAVPGVYVIRVINGENVKVQKIVVR